MRSRVQKCDLGCKKRAWCYPCFIHVSCFALHCHFFLLVSFAGLFCIIHIRPSRLDLLSFAWHHQFFRRWVFFVCFFCWSLLEVSFVFCVGLFCLIFLHLSLIDSSSLHCIVIFFCLFFLLVSFGGLFCFLCRSLLSNIPTPFSYWFMVLCIASSFFFPVFVHPHTHVHIYTHTQTHTRTHTYKHTHTHTHTSGMACVTGYRTWFYYVVRGVRRDLNLTMTVNNMNPQVPLCVCVTWLTSGVWYDWFDVSDMTPLRCDMTSLMMCVTWLTSDVWHDLLTCDTTYSTCVTWLVWCVWHDSFKVCDMTRLTQCVWHDSFDVCDMTHFRCVTWLTWHVTRLTQCVWHDHSQDMTWLLWYVTWLTSCVCHNSLNIRHDTPNVRDMTHLICEMSLFTRDMALFMCVTWLTRRDMTRWICDMTHSTCDMTNLICEMSLFTRDMTHWICDMTH